MKVKHLILRLQELNPEATVVVDGYEGGVEELKNLHAVRVILDVNSEFYYGPHEIRDDGEIDAVYLPRS